VICHARGGSDDADAVRAVYYEDENCVLEKKLREKREKTARTFVLLPVAGERGGVVLDPNLTRSAVRSSVDAPLRTDERHSLLEALGEERDMRDGI
jgi:hypothetical protein